MDKKLKKAIRAGDWEAFKRIRYDTLGEGEVFVVRGLDLQGVDFKGMPAHFISFEDCNLRNGDFAGSRFFPCSFKNCDMVGVDLSSTSGMMFCLDCDLRGVKFADTLLFDRKHSDQASAFQDCKLDEDFRALLEGQGVEFALTPQTIRYAFGGAP